MRKIVFTLLAICFVITGQAQFLYKLERAQINSAPFTALTPLNITNQGTLNNLSPAAMGLVATITSVNLSITTQINLINNTPPPANKALGLGQTFILGAGNSESISVVEILSGHVSKDRKDRLSFGGAVAKSDSKEGADMKTLFQGGGNFFLSYSYPLWIQPSGNRENFMALIVRGKLGAILPNAGASTNIIQASFDPGLELHFSISTHNEDIGINASIRSSVLWASKDFSDATGFKENLIPYNFITGGIKLKSLGTIVYSQSFLSKNLTGISQPKGSLGFSFTL